MRLLLKMLDGLQVIQVYLTHDIINALRGQAWWDLFWGSSLSLLLGRLIATTTSDDSVASLQSLITVSIATSSHCPTSSPCAPSSPPEQSSSPVASPSTGAARCGSRGGGLFRCRSFSCRCFRIGCRLLSRSFLCSGGRFGGRLLFGSRNFDAVGIVRIGGVGAVGAASGQSICITLLSASKRRICNQQGQ